MGWASAVAQVAGSVLTNSANAGINKDQRIWSTEMSNTEMQRRVADLKAAGLNPMLAGMNQQGASYSTPSQIAMENPLKDIGTAINAGSQRAANSAAAAKGNADAGLVQAQTGLISAQRENIQADTALKTEQAGLAATSAQSTHAGIQNINAEYTKLQNEIHNIILDGDLKSQEIAQNSKIQPLLQQMGQLEVQRTKLGLPKLQNESNAQQSWWMRNVSPYLPDMLKSSGASAAAGAAFSNFKR